MSYICPVCNGIRPLAAQCPVCCNQTQDYGNVSDFFGPYSPYRDKDDLAMTDGFEHNLAQHICMHFVYCQACGHSYKVPVQEEMGPVITPI